MDSPQFLKLYNKLNKAQKEAVDSIEGPIMVIAGPGTGKTTILTLRIANILRKTDTPPSGILAITFTESGVKAMRIKLREIIGNRADEVRIHTFHGFAASVINEFKDHFVHLERTTQITEIESESIIRALLEQKEFHDLRPYGNPDFYVQKIISSISDCKREETVRATRGT
jgi:DNA helicase-2/ATP-dependent DNA helicase PcrA